MSFTLIPSLFDYSLTDATNKEHYITKQDAEKLFTFFATCTLFKWTDTHNNCEARAEIVCTFLNHWKIPHYKAWVFSGAFLKNHIGGLHQHWNYHVAALVQVMENKEIVPYIIDPSTCNTLQTLQNWAENITAYPHSYHFIKQPIYYIFNHKKITKENWHKQNKQNKKWAIQGLAGINGLSAKGKSALCFNKNKIRQTQQQLQYFLKQHKSFL